MEFASANQPPSAAPMPYPAFAAPPPPPGPRRSRIALISVAAIATAVVIGGAGVAIGVAVSDSGPTEQARPTESERPSTQDLRESARQAACDFTTTMINYDYRDLDSYKRSVDAGSTGTLKSDFDRTFPDLRDSMVGMQMSSKSSDIRCVYQSGNNKRAEVKVHADYTVTQALEPAPQNQRHAFRVTMERVDGRWLCSEMTPSEPE
ncbi:Uncharacterised protein [Nocardia cyriacigeorgica]|uniref:Mce-associated membrane protein n=2 Tax=Nocardia cyriacigeorgica TaxID=135487 RepID=A0A4V6ICN3_9NOCA|nr:Uncharacterised protein [Nocardia cyriacigeorgica]